MLLNVIYKYIYIYIFKKVSPDDALAQMRINFGENDCCKLISFL